MPKQGVSSSFSFGFAAGAAQAMATANAIPIRLVRPNIWKKALKLTGGKDASRRLASELFPRYADQWVLKEHDGRAEAALLAYYAATWTPPRHHEP